MRLRHLEIALEGLSGYENPDILLEQYNTPASVAARFLHQIFMAGDIDERRVCDLGCGTGVLACGAALLGAVSVTGLDADPSALEIAERNAGLLGVDVEWVCADVLDYTDSCPPDSFDTVVMNPPFGAQNTNVHADRQFVDAAVRLAPLAYGIFNSGTGKFLGKYLNGRAKVEIFARTGFPLRRMYAHHRKDLIHIDVEMIRIQSLH
jgi:putative methylase